MAAQIRIKATGKGAKPKPPINFFFFFSQRNKRYIKQTKKGKQIGFKIIK